MDTRSKSTEAAGRAHVKRSHPFAAWVCFSLGLIIVGGCLLSAIALALVPDGGIDVLRAPFIDYQDTRFFRERTRFYFSFLFSLADDHSGETDDIMSRDESVITQMLDSEGENLVYGIVGDNLVGEDTVGDDTAESNAAGGSAVGGGNAGDPAAGDGIGDGAEGLDVTNVSGGLTSLIGLDNMPAVPDGYGYCWYFDGQKVWVISDGVPVDTDRLDSGYRDLIPNAPFFGLDHEADISGVRAILAVKDVLVENPYGHSRYYGEQRTLYIAGRVAIALLAVGIALLAYGIAKRDERHFFESKMASWSGRLWFEVKVLISGLVFGGAMELSRHWLRGGEWILNALYVAVVIGVYFWVYMLLVDLRYNRARFFTHNSVSSLLARYRRYEAQYPWQKRMLKRIYALLGAEVFLAFLAFCFAMAVRSGLGFLAAVFSIGTGVYLILRYLSRYGQTVSDWGHLMDHIREIKNGDMETKLDVAKDSDVFPAAQDLNSIQEGMSLAVSERVKSERMKVDLITNVSHDLKTPLTSIVSYLELLSNEEGLPESAEEYVKILGQKTERLKNLIQDLFELSKASSDNMALDMERIDLVRLTRQVLADMDEPIDSSGLVFRVNLPDDPIYTISDGGKLYRVLQNLISNALKYSLQGSRIFIDLVENKGEATIVIKNTANYEMDFTADEILQRFTRGDRSRSTEGSGLGLSIAKGFTEACGGRFSIGIDGDQFSVQVSFSTD